MAVKLKPVGEQVIVITGATSGIGLATAREAAKRGARLVVCSRDEVDLKHVADELNARNGKVVYVVADVGDYEGMQIVADQAVSSFGGVDTWINNAGTSIFGEIVDIPLDDAERMFRTNYWGVVNGSLVALPLLKKRGGVLINVGSDASETAAPLQGHYVASKHAVKGFTDTLRLELEKNGDPVVVTLIQPAAIDTQFLDHSKTYLGVTPNHAAPVYDAKIVANAILTCAERPHRNLRVGGAAKLSTTIEKVAPRIGDRMKKRVVFDDSMSDLPKGPDGDTLWEPRSGDVSEVGSYQGRVKQRSLYTSAALHPMATLLGAAALGIGIAAVISTRNVD